MIYCNTNNLVVFETKFLFKVADFKFDMNLVCLDMSDDMKKMIMSFNKGKDS